MTAVPITPRPAGAPETLRPFVWFAVAAFLLGLVGYVSLGQSPLGGFRHPATPAQLPSPDPANPAIRV